MVKVVGTVTTVEEISTAGEGSRESYSPPRAHARDVPPPDLESEPPTPTEQVIGEWIASLQHPPLPQIVRAVGVIVNGALHNGLPIDGVRAGLAAWQARRYGPGALAGFIHEHASATRPSTALAVHSPPQQRGGTDDRVNGWLALGAAA